MIQNEAFATTAYSCKNVVEEGEPVVDVFHKPDGTWIMLCGGDEHDEDAEQVVVQAAELLKRDASLAQLATLERGWYAERTGAGASWTTAEFREDK